MTALLPVGALPLPILLGTMTGLAAVLAGVAVWLVEQHRREPGLRSCIHCGCTDDHACPGGCWWISTRPPICSRCAPDAA